MPISKDPPTPTHAHSKNVGRSLHMAARCGQSDKMSELLDSLDDLEPVEKDVALEWTDKDGNNHLHAFVTGETEDEEVEAKLGVCLRLLEQGFILADKNDKGQTPLDLASGEIKKRLPALEKEAQVSKRARGLSLIAEGATVKSMASAAYVLMAAQKFKNRSRRNSTEVSPHMAGPAAGPPEEVMEV